MSRTQTRTWRPFITGLLLFFAAIQLVPYGRNHLNPPVGQEPPWNSPATRALVVRTCFNCHSNSTRWPAYASIAPASWIVQHDVNEARARLNFSEWQRPQPHARDAAEIVRRNGMPPALYTLAHPDARLDAGELARLIDGLSKTFGEPIPSH